MEARIITPLVLRMAGVADLDQLDDSRLLGSPGIRSRCRKIELLYLAELAYFLEDLRRLPLRVRNQGTQLHRESRVGDRAQLESRSLKVSSYLLPVENRELGAVSLKFPALHARSVARIAREVRLRYLKLHMLHAKDIFLGLFGHPCLPEVPSAIRQLSLLLLLAFGGLLPLHARLILVIIQVNGVSFSSPALKVLGVILSRRIKILFLLYHGELLITAQFCLPFPTCYVEVLPDRSQHLRGKILQLKLASCILK